jgi:hypothetical protein
MRCVSRHLRRPFAGLERESAQEETTGWTWSQSHQADRMIHNSQLVAHLPRKEGKVERQSVQTIDTAAQDMSR